MASSAQIICSLSKTRLRCASRSARAASPRRPWLPRPFSSSSADLPPLGASHPSLTVWGANTDVGKTLISAGLSASLVSSGSSVSYVKPVQTGFPKDSDSRSVFNKVRSILTHSKSECKRKVYASHGIHNVSPAVIKFHEHPNIHEEEPFVKASIKVSNGVCSKEGRKVPFHDEDNLYGFEEAVFEANPDAHDGKWFSRSRLSHESLHDASSCFISSTEWSWFRPVSPHVAAAEEGLHVDDDRLLDRVSNSLACFQKSSIGLEQNNGGFTKWAIVETAGGVASPGPSGTLQCDLYRPLRLPSLLVGDGKLGGISSTIAAYESLSSRGYDVDAIIFLDYQLGNEHQLQNYLRHRIPVLVLPALPDDMNDQLIQWFIRSGNVFSQLQCHLEAAYTQKLSRLRNMKKKAGELLWWPFTQHSLVPEEKITVIDARVGDMFTIYKHDYNSEVTRQQFDGCASWWTQGPDIKLQMELSRQIGYAAGRFGHVMLPENVYEPALQCAELLIDLIGKGWADRVYYSDNGSTAVEIAIKMAFRKYLHDKNLLAESHSEMRPHNLKVIALKGSYHGDTLGAQDAQSPSPYTGFLQQPWYQGRGLFLDAPQIFMVDGKWRVLVPESFQALKSDSVLNGISYESRDYLFDKERDQSPLADVYKDYVKHGLSSSIDGLPAALIIEPVIHGAGGMMLVDPLFQRILIAECKERKIPVIFDEVFAGCWRLGVQSCTEYLHSTPDIACYSKLLTGGSIPLAATLASASVFEAFKGTSKLQALLHGHSYSGNAVACQAAITSLKWFSNRETNQNLLPCGSRLLELWEPSMVNELSRHPAVQRVIALGTVFALELKSDASDSGYASMSSQRIVQALREEGIYNRPLGNVIYLMCGPLTSPAKCSKLLCKLSQQLDVFLERNGCSKSRVSSAAG